MAWIKGRLLVQLSEKQVGSFLTERTIKALRFKCQYIAFSCFILSCVGTLGHSMKCIFGSLVYVFKLHPPESESTPKKTVVIALPTQTSCTNGKSLKFTIHLHCLMPPTLGNLMIPESGAYLKKGNIPSHPSGPLGFGASQGFSWDAFHYTEHVPTI